MPKPILDYIILLLLLENIDKRADGRSPQPPSLKPDAVVWGQPFG